MNVIFGDEYSTVPTGRDMFYSSLPANELAGYFH